MVVHDLVSIEDSVRLDGIVLCHPYLSTSTVPLEINGKMDFVNLLDSKEYQKIYREQIFKMIDDADKVWSIVMLVNKPYRLLWFKMLKEYFDKKDYGQLLSEIWIDSENPNDDVNVPVEESIEFFKEAKKHYLMEKNELEVYKCLEDEFTVYRGVSVGRNPNGLSYTLSKDKAIWFQKRFEKEDKHGYLIERRIKKSQVLAFFERRGEMEIVVDTTGFSV